VQRFQHNYSDLIACGVPSRRTKGYTVQLLSVHNSDGRKWSALQALCGYFIVILTHSALSCLYDVLHKLHLSVQ
jgi:hypothetical protein